jgi:hypothetical protein
MRFCADHDLLLIAGDAVHVSSIRIAFPELQHLHDHTIRRAFQSSV